MNWILRDHWSHTCVISLRQAWLSPWKARGSSHLFLPWFLGCVNATTPAKPCQGFEIDHWISENFEMCEFGSVAQSCPTLCDPMNCSTPGLPVHHQLPESTQTHVHCVGDAIQPSHPPSSPSPPAVDLSQHQGLFKWVSSSHQMAKVLEFQLQHQPFQWIFRTDFL